MKKHNKYCSEFVMLKNWEQISAEDPLTQFQIH